MILFADFRDRDVGGPVVPGRFVDPVGHGLSPRECGDALRAAEQVAVLVHGFNVNRPSGTEAFRRLGGVVAGPACVALVVTWPGDSWAGPLGYPLEGNDADDSAEELARFLDRELPAWADLSFASHSLGARVVFETIRRLPPRFMVREVCVTAAAVDDVSLNRRGRYAGVADGSRRTTVLASRADRVLTWAYPAGDLVQSWLFAWKEQAGRALGLRGPRQVADDPTSPKVRVEHIPAAIGVDHGDYVTSGAQGPKHDACAAFVGAVLRGAGDPVYALAPT